MVRRVLPLVLFAGCLVRAYVDPPQPTTDLYTELHAIEVNGGGYARVTLQSGSVLTGRVIDVSSQVLSLQYDGVNHDIPLETIQRFQVGEVDVPVTILASLGIVAAAGAGVGLAFLLLGLVASLLKGSCPFIYVMTAHGPVLVGEGYSGAVLGALERMDRVALPDASGALRIRLGDEADETQKTNAAWLVVVDHPAGTRALATMDGRTMLVGEAMAATVTDLEGHDLSTELAADDKQGWATNMQAAADSKTPPEQEGLIAQVEAAPSSPALELVYSNHPWLDVLGRQLWNGLGSQTAAVQEQDRNPSERARLEEKLRLAGVYTAVEIDRPSGWETVAWLPPPGWVAPRHVVVPLPAEAGAPLKVRIRGSTGFLVVNSMGVTGVVDAHPAETVVPAAKATQWDGQDALAALQTMDDTRQVLPERGTWVDVDFEVPPEPSEGERDLFLQIGGYYEVHPGPEARLDLKTVTSLGLSPDHVGRFSVDLYRRFFARMVQR